jgi:ubiquinone/menaquinone biosynthesis C-methylase UbiE
MAFYRERIVPCLTHLAMRQRTLLPYRARAVAAAEGRVLEIGIGSGLNLPLYGGGVDRVVGIDPSAGLLRMARAAAGHATRPVELIEGSAEAIPLEDRSFDTVVTSWTLCSIPDVGRALGEMRRVLRPGGRLVFVEHGQSPDPGVRRWQDRLTPFWRRLSGGCHLNRDIGGLVGAAGFRVERLDTGYMKGPKTMAFLYEGVACR